MRRRYTHTDSIKPFRIRNQFSHSSHDETAELRSFGNDFNKVLSEDIDMEDINDELDYDNEEIFAEDIVITKSSDDDDEEESIDELKGNNDDNYEEGESSNDDNDEEVESNNNEEEVIHQIVEALDEDKLPSCDGEFAPYFNNYTTTALFCWLQKHNISTNAYEDLVNIIHNPQFEPNHVVKNIQRFRSWRKRLPLLPIITKSIKISSKKTPSTSRGSKLAYQLSISEIIWCVLNNPMLMKHMYFGPGINSEKKSEYWHRTLWGESPLFG